MCLTSVIYSKLLSSYLNLKLRYVRMFVCTFIHTCAQYIIAYLSIHYSTICIVLLYVRTHIQTVCKYSMHVFVRTFTQTHKCTYMCTICLIVDLW